MYLSHRAQVLYLRGLRRYMDFSTGVVGDRRRVSFQQMRECLEVNPEKASTVRRYQPTDNEIRASLAQLERRGLIRRLPKAHKLDPMRFFLPLASIRPNQEPQKNHKRTQTGGLSDKSTGYSSRATKGPPAKSDIPPVSDKTPVLRAREEIVDNSEPIADRGEWARVLTEMGFRREQIFSAKNLIMLESWVDRGLVLEEFRAAVDVAHARNDGMPANVAYYRWAVDEIIKQRGRKASAGGGYGQGWGCRESGASILARGCASAFEPDDDGS